MALQYSAIERDRSVWDGCADIYERKIVNGHPDVTAYETFEHGFIDRLVTHLTRDCNHTLHCYDFGCGSGRIHELLVPHLHAGTSNNADFTEPPEFHSGRIAHIGGIDFSERMINLARSKLNEAGYGGLFPGRLSFDIGSAFDVPPYTGEHTPLAISVCNSIGVMQGPEGACKLFRAMGNYVRERKGIAMISCYCREAVADYALGNYESTMDVSGQPCWLKPRTFASAGYRLIPRYFKRAYDRSPAITVDVLDSSGSLVQSGFTLERDPQAVEKVIATGVIETYGDYRSRWYGTELIMSWMREFWHDGTLWHIPGARLDRLHGEPAQIALLDLSGSFDSLARTWNLQPLPLHGEEQAHR